MSSADFQDIAELIWKKIKMVHEAGKLPLFYAGGKNLLIMARNVHQNFRLWDESKITGKECAMKIAQNAMNATLYTGLNYVQMIAFGLITNPQSNGIPIEKCSDPIASPIDPNK